MINGESSYRRFLSGDESAFDEIMINYRDSLTFFINRFVKDYSTAEDIAIDVFMYIIVHPNRYNFKVSLKTYLFMLGRSRAIDFLRKKKRRNEASLDGGEECLHYDFQSLIEKKEKDKPCNCEEGILIRTESGDYTVNTEKYFVRSDKGQGQLTLQQAEEIKEIIERQTAN